jgi:hypothetical protein
MKGTDFQSTDDHYVIPRPADEDLTHHESLQLGPITVPRVFIEAHKRRPYDDWRSITHHNFNQ